MSRKGVNNISTSCLRLGSEEGFSEVQRNLEVERNRPARSKPPASPVSDRFWTPPYERSSPLRIGAPSPPPQYRVLVSSVPSSAPLLQVGHGRSRHT